MGGGQKMGEMETNCYISHDALINLNEMLGMKSDCMDLKNKYIRETIGSEFSRDDKNIDTIPESSKLLEAYLKVIGIGM